MRFVNLKVARDTVSVDKRWRSHVSHHHDFWSLRTSLRINEKNRKRLFERGKY